MQDAFLTFLIVSVAYIVTFSLTLWVCISLYNNSCSAAYPAKLVCYFCRMECECLRFTSMDGEGCSIFYRRAT